MATGGRVLHHLKRMAPDPRHHLVFAGFQVGGSRGARMVGGEPEVKIHGEYVPVHAQVSQLQGFSGHADADGLLAWLRTLPQAPRQTLSCTASPTPPIRCAHRIQDELRLARARAAARRAGQSLVFSRAQAARQWNSRSRSHFVATHFSPSITGAPPCSVRVAGCGRS